MANLKTESGTLNQELIDKILADMDANRHRFKNASDLFAINEGELLPFVEEALAAELSPTAFERARKRISPVNVLPKVVSKLSTLYNLGVSRTVEEDDETGSQNVEVNQEIVDYYVKEFGMDPRMDLSQEQFNLNKYTALEPYLDTTSEEPVPKLRILPAHTFWVYSDNHMDPTEPTVFIKILGGFNKHTGEAAEDGTFETRTVTVFMGYTDTDIIAFDSDGEARPEFMESNPEGINPYGQIPFIYIANSEYSLIPNPNTDTKPLTILIPKLLTDLNYASQFMSHSIIYAIDANIEGLSGNPDAVWNVKSETTQDGADVNRAQIGTIKPEVDIAETLNLIKTQTQMWLDTMGLRASSVGDLTVENAASGISKLIDESDATAVREGQAVKYQDVEREFWELVGVMHNTWLEMGENLKERRVVTGDLKVRVEFPPQEPVKDEEKIIRTEAMKLKEGLTSKRRAIAAANPDLDETEVDELMEEIKKEKDDMMGGMGALLRSADTREPDDEPSDSFTDADNNGSN